MIVQGISYKKPQVTLLQETGIGTSEFAGRTAYDSFDNAESVVIKDLNDLLCIVEDDNSLEIKSVLEDVNKISSSKLLDELAWVHHHHSVMEHASLTYSIKGTSRGVLQELARHRIASYTVRSTRYTMSSVINAYVASSYPNFNSMVAWKSFYKLVSDMNLFVTDDYEYNKLQIKDMFEKLNLQYKAVGKDDFLKMSIAKSSLYLFDASGECLEPKEIYNRLQSGKKKRNVGDAFKHLVNDNWSTDVVMTINLRSLKNFFGLRDSGAAWFQIQWLAEEMKTKTPNKYLKLIHKDFRDA